MGIFPIKILRAKFSYDDFLTELTGSSQRFSERFWCTKSKANLQIPPLPPGLISLIMMVRPGKLEHLPRTSTMLFFLKYKNKNNNNWRKHGRRTRGSSGWDNLGPVSIENRSRENNKRRKREGEFIVFWAVLIWIKQTVVKDGPWSRYNIREHRLGPALRLRSRLRSYLHFLVLYRAPFGFISAQTARLLSRLKWWLNWVMKCYNWIINY